MFKILVWNIFILHVLARATNDDVNNSNLLDESIRLVNQKQSDFEKLPKTQSKQKGVVFIGPSGSGKIHVINYLLGIPYTIEYNVSESFKIRPFNRSNVGLEKPDEKMFTQTINPPDEDYTFVNDVDFDLINGSASQIAVSFFRHETIKNMSEFKFILVFTHSNFGFDRGQFSKAIKYLCNLLDVDKNDNSKNELLSKSIGFVILNLKYQGSTDNSKFKNSAMNSYLSTLEQEKNKKKINAKEKSFIEDILSDVNRIEMLLVPFNKTKMIQTISLPSVFRPKVNAMLNRLEYFQMSDFQMKMLISDPKIDSSIRSKASDWDPIVKSSKRSLIKQFMDDLLDRDLSSIDENLSSNIQILSDILENVHLNRNQLTEQLEKMKTNSVLKTDVQYFVSNMSFITFLREFIYSNGLTNVSNLENDSTIPEMKSKFDEKLSNLISKLKSNYRERTKILIPHLLHRIFTNSLLAQNYDYARLESFKLFFSYLQGKSSLLLDTSQLVDQLERIDADFSERFISSLDFNVTLAINAIHNLTNLSRIRNTSDSLSSQTFVGGNLLDQFDVRLAELIRRRMKSFQSHLDDAIIDHINNRLNDLIQPLDVQRLVYDLDRLKQIHNRLTSFKNFVQTDLDFRFVPDSSKQKYLLEQLTNLTRLSSTPRNLLATIFETSWSSERVMWKVDTLKTELNSLLKVNLLEVENKNGSMTFSGAFLNMTTIVRNLNQNTYAKVRILKIFATQSFVFDANLIVNKSLYKYDAPSVVIVAKYVEFTQSVLVNLSCDYVPGYPDGRKKPEYNNSTLTIAGADGKEGLPGCNAGSLIIFSNQISGKHKLNFIAKSGNGGPGQDGGDGLDGKQGKHASLLDLQSEYPQSIKNQPGYFDYSTSEEDNLFEKKIVYSYWYKKKGEPGEPGGDSGKPGCGGKPGLNGQLLIMCALEPAANENRTYNDLKPASSGRDGEPGLAGIGGLYGDDHIACARWIWKIKTFWEKPAHYFDSWTNDQGVLSRNRTASGKVQTECVRSKSNTTTINIYEIETEYLNYTSQYLGKKFPNLIQNQAYFVCAMSKSRPLTLNDLIKRTQALDSADRVDLKLFDKLKSEIATYYETLSAREREKQNPVVQYLVSTVLSLESRRFDQDTLIYVDFGSFLRKICTQINEIKETRKRDDLRKSVPLSYENSLKSRIDELVRQLRELIQDLKVYEDEIRQKADQMQNELKHVQNSNDELRKEKIKNIQKYKDAKVRERVSSILNVACDILMIFGPKARLIGTIAKVGIGFANSLVKKDSGQENEIENELHEINNELVKSMNRIDQLRSYRTKINSTANNKNGKNNKINSLLDVIKSHVGILSLQKQSKATDDNKFEKDLNAIDERFNRLLELENQIVNFENETIVKIAQFRKFKDYNRVNTELLRWKSKDALINLKLELSQLPDFLGPKLSFLNTITRMENSLSTIMDIFSKIDLYQDQISLARYMAELTSIDAGLTPTALEYKQHIDELKQQVDRTMLTQYYEQALQALSYWSFPFVCHFANGLSNPNATELLSFDALIAHYAQNLNTLQEKFTQMDNQLLMSIHNYRHNYRFENESAFFAWSSIDYPFEFGRLFVGERVSLNAYVHYSKFDAVKFNKIFVLIETRNKTRPANRKLDELLANFHVRLVHSGQSNYLYKGSVYMIHDSRLTINDNDVQLTMQKKLLLSYLYKYKSSGGEHRDGTDSYNKIAANKPFLSPYTLWDVQLELDKTAEHRSAEIFDQLKAILNDPDEEIVLTLNGFGQFVHDDYREPRDAEECMSRSNIYSNIIKIS